MKNKHVMLVFAFILLLVSIGGVHASSVFVVEPSKEVTYDVECPDGVQSFAGNVSAVGGNIDFYVTNPSGSIVANYENISFTDFEVNTPQNGTYICHLVNRLSTNNVSAELSYGRNFFIALQENIQVESGLGVGFQQNPSSSGIITTVRIVMTFLDQLPKIRELYEQIKPQESPFPSIDPEEWVYAAVIIPLAIVVAFSSELRRKNLKSIMLSLNFKRLSLLRERRRINEKKRLRYEVI